MSIPHPRAVRACSRARVVKRAKSEGFTLLEVLVAIVVLSFGLLGVVGLQAGALQANKEARYQSAAVRLGRELGDLMRGNRYVWTTLASTANPYLQTPPSAMPTNNCYTTICSSTDAASFQMYEWMQRVKAELPDARVSICYDSAPFDSSGKPQWACATGGDVVYVKLGWTQSTTNRADTVVRTSASYPPSVILPVLPN